MTATKELTQLAATLNDARLAANAIPATAPQYGIYGDIANTLKRTLRLIDINAAEDIYQRLLDGEDVPAAIRGAKAAARKVAAAKPVRKRIHPKFAGEKMNLAFHGTYDRTVDENTLVKVEGEGDDARATFRDAAGMEWEAYRYNNRWAYGSGAHRLTVVQDDGVVRS